MGIKAQAVTPHWFVPESQKDDPKPARFRVRPLTALEWYALADSFGSTAESARTVIDHGLLGWENIEHPETGEALKFDSDAIWTLPREILDEIGEHIVESSRTSEDQAKN